MQLAAFAALSSVWCAHTSPDDDADAAREAAYEAKFQSVEHTDVHKLLKRKHAPEGPDTWGDNSFIIGKDILSKMKIDGTAYSAILPTPSPTRAPTPAPSATPTHAPTIKTTAPTPMPTRSPTLFRGESEVEDERFDGGSMSSQAAVIAQTSSLDDQLKDRPIGDRVANMVGRIAAFFYANQGKNKVNDVNLGSAEEKQAIALIRRNKSFSLMTPFKVANKTALVLKKILPTSTAEQMALASGAAAAAVVEGAQHGSTNQAAEAAQIAALQASQFSVDDPIIAAKAVAAAGLYSRWTKLKALKAAEKKAKVIGDIVGSKYATTKQKQRYVKLADTDVAAELEMPPSAAPTLSPTVNPTTFQNPVPSWRQVAHKANKRLGSKRAYLQQIAENIEHKGYGKAQQQLSALPQRKNDVSRIGGGSAWSAALSVEKKNSHGW